MFPRVLSCRDEVCQITVSGRRACYEDGNVRAARQGIGDARGVGHQADIDHGTWSSRRAIRTRTRLMGGCLAGTITTLSRADSDDMSDSNEGNRMRSQRDPDARRAASG